MCNTKLAVVNVKFLFIFEAINNIIKKNEDIPSSDGRRHIHTLSGNPR
jgi:hypothetical protein